MVSFDAGEARIPAAHAVLDRLVDVGLGYLSLGQPLTTLSGGKSVIVIEHHRAVMVHADWIIDLGSGAGHDGGRVVFEGTPAGPVAACSTLTGEHLAAYVGTGPKPSWKKTRWRRRHPKRSFFRNYTWR